MKEVKRYIVTITDVIAPTSMPLNEFVLYRKGTYPKEKQAIILLFKDKVNPGTQVPEDIKLHIVGKNIKRLRDVVAEIAKECNKAEIPLIFHIHEAKSILFFDLATKGKYRNQVVYTLHSTYKNYPLRTKVLCRLASARCRTVVCVSKTSYKYYPEALKKKHNVVEIQNGVDLARVDQALLEAVKPKKDKLELVYVARLVALKRHKMLFDIIKQLPNVQLVLIGQGPMEEELKAYVKENGIADQVEFLGAMQRDDLYRRVSQADVYVSTSSYEGLPIGVLEAMRCGLPCVLSNIEQHSEIQAVCPSVILADDMQQWCEQINLLADESYRKALGRKSKAEVEHLSLERMHQQYDAVYAASMD